MAASLRNTLAMLQGIRDSGQSEIVVAFSGGKDSWAVLDMCSRVFSRIHPYFYYLVKGLEIEEVALRAAESRYKVEIARFPNPCVAGMLRSGDYLPKTWKLRRNMSEADYYAIMRSRTGCKWIAFGHRMNESLQRRGMLKPIGGCDEIRHKVYPLWDWNAKEVYGYLRHRRIVSLVRTAGADTSAVTLAPSSLRFLREHHPGDYARILAQFPLVDAILLRDDKRIAEGGTSSRERSL